MTDWFAPFEDLTAPSDDVMWSRCRVGHRFHERSIVFPDKTLFDGIQPAFRIYHWQDHGGDRLDKWAEYCPGQDVISQTIDRTGVWERNESLLFVDILQSGDPTSQVVIDFGCQIGWYATIAATHRYPVAAVDVNAENLGVASVNIAAVTSASYGTFLGAVDEHAPQLSADMPVRVAKIDIEGAERHAVAMLAPALKAGNVDFLLVEISPVFNDSYLALMQQVIGWGYEAWQIPTGKGFDHFGRRINNPESWLVNLHQADVLFVRSDLT